MHTLPSAYTAGAARGQFEPCPAVWTAWAWSHARFGRAHRQCLDENGQVPHRHLVWGCSHATLTVGRWLLAGMIGSLMLGKGGGFTIWMPHL